MSIINIFWFRRDLRVHDNPGLYQALRSGHPVLPLFIFDRNRLEKLPSDDLRVDFINQQLKALRERLKRAGSDLLVLYGEPLEQWKEILSKYKVAKVFFNHDYEPYAIQRDSELHRLLSAKGISFASFKDHVIYEKSEILTSTKTPYLVFTPYYRRWKTQLESDQLPKYPSEKTLGSLLKVKSPFSWPSLTEMGFEPRHFNYPKLNLDPQFLQNYSETRDQISKDHGTGLGLYLRFGIVSLRDVVETARAHSESLLRELCWRDFFIQILFHFPEVEHRSFKEKYENIKWREPGLEYERWKKGETGYPLVDAGMRQLNAIGYMPNRVRMLVASFLCKHLLIHWTHGESYFAIKLLDYEMASNNGNWQWAAGTGSDAAPYFRIFNPITQAKRFDPDQSYIRRWVSEYGTNKYPKPIVDHDLARKRALEAFKTVQ